MTTPPIPGQNTLLTRTFTRATGDSTNITGTTATLTVQRQPSLGQARGAATAVTVDSTVIDNTAGTVVCKADTVTLTPGVYVFHWTLTGGLVYEFEEEIVVHRARVG